MPITVYLMITVKFQSPTQGPLITVTIDDKWDSDITRAFMAAPGVQVLKEIAAGTRAPELISSIVARRLISKITFFAKAAPYILPLICASDSSVRPAPLATNDPVPMPDDVTVVTEASASPELVRLAEDLAKQITSSTVLHEDQKIFLNQLLDKVRAGHLGLDRLLENIWKILTDDLLNRAERLGATIQQVVRGDLCYARIQYDPANVELKELLSPLLHILLAIQYKIPDLPPLVEENNANVTVFIPTWKTMVDLYHPHLVDIEWVARVLDAEEKIPFYEAKRAPVRIVVGRLHEFLDDFGRTVHPLVFMMFEIYHALSVSRLAPEKKIVLDILRGLLSTDKKYAESFLARMLSLAMRLASPLSDRELADAIWEVLELDLALRAMKIGATVEISDDIISISGSVNDRALADLMNPVLRAMHAVRKKSMTVVRVNLAGKKNTINLVRWSQFKPRLNSLRGISWEEYVESLRQDVDDLGSRSSDGHPLATAWETVTGEL